MRGCALAGQSSRGAGDTCVSRVASVSSRYGPAAKDRGRSVLNGRKGAGSDAFSSARHGYSAVNTGEIECMSRKRPPEVAGRGEVPAARCRTLPAGRQVGSVASITTPAPGQADGSCTYTRRLFRVRCRSHWLRSDAGGADVDGGAARGQIPRADAGVLRYRGRKAGRA